MRIALLALMLLSSVVLADTPIEKATYDCRIVLDQNFNALVMEDADALLDTMSPQMAAPAAYAEFRREAEEMFAATDVYVRCVDFKLYSFKPPFAEAVVVQHTAPKNEDDHHPVQQGRLNFRHHSALLPEHQLVWYKQRFQRVNGEWKLHLVLTEPQPVDADKVSAIKASVEQSSCANGRCSFPSRAVSRAGDVK